MSADDPVADAGNVVPVDAARMKAAREDFRARFTGGEIAPAVLDRLLAGKPRRRVGVGAAGRTAGEVFVDELSPADIAAALAGSLVFRPPIFSRRPVLVEVAAVEKTIGVLTEIASQHAGAAVTEPLSNLVAAMVALCWPYIVRLVEDNCVPGHQLHPAVRPVYESFLTVQRAFVPADTSGHYAQWMAGDLNVPEATASRYIQRWTESRPRRSRHRVPAVPHAKVFSPTVRDRSR